MEKNPDWKVLASNCFGCCCCCFFFCSFNDEDDADDKADENEDLDDIVESVQTIYDANRAVATYMGEDVSTNDTKLNNNLNHLLSPFTLQARFTLGSLDFLTVGCHFAPPRLFTPPPMRVF
jgi:hypothetical protein